MYFYSSENECMCVALLHRGSLFYSLACNPVVVHSRPTMRVAAAAAAAARSSAELVTTVCSAVADWAKEATTKLLHRLTTGAAGKGNIQMVFEIRIMFLISDKSVHQAPFYRLQKEIAGGFSCSY
jgi:hypothetical protein